MSSVHTNGKLHRTSKSNLCPTCRHDHSCSQNDDGLILCLRSKGELPGFDYYGTSDDGVWGLYRRGGDEPRTLSGPSGSPSRPGTTAPPRPVIHWDFLQAVNSMSARRTPPDDCLDRLEELADALGVSEAALETVGAGWDDDSGVWTFPERDAAGRITGMATRDRDGSKRMVTGSVHGLTIPPGVIDQAAAAGVLLIVEGASDTAAGVTLDFPTVGRFSDRGGADLLTELLRGLPDTVQVIVLGENDQKDDGRWPGRDGAEFVAEKLRVNLGREVTAIMPPSEFKDLRAWLRSCDHRNANSLAALRSAVLTHLKLRTPADPPFDLSEFQSDLRPALERCQCQRKVPLYGTGISGSDVTMVPCGCWDCPACGEFLTIKNVAHFEQKIAPFEKVYVVNIIGNGPSTAMDCRIGYAVSAANSRKTEENRALIDELVSEVADLESKGRRIAAEGIHDQIQKLAAEIDRPVHGFVKLRLSETRRVAIISTPVDGATEITRAEAVVLNEQILRNIAQAARNNPDDRERGPVRYSRTWALPKRVRGTKKILGRLNGTPSQITLAIKSLGRLISADEKHGKWLVRTEGLTDARIAYRSLKKFLEVMNPSPVMTGDLLVDLEL